MRFLFISLAALLLAYADAPGQESGSLSTLSLQDAVATGVEHSSLLRSADARVDAAGARASETAAALLPSVRMEAGYRRLSDVPPFEVRLPSSPQSFVISPTVLDNYSLRVGVQQPVFTGFRLRSGARAAEMLAEAAAEDGRNDRADVVLTITTAYWTLYQARQVRNLVDENTLRLERYLGDTRNLMKAGLATRNDYLRVDVQRSGARLNQIDAANDVQVASMTLNILLGFPLETELELTSAPADTVVPSADHAAGISREDRLAEVRPDLLAMNLRVNAAREYLTAARGAWWPQIALTGNVYYNRPNQRYLPTKDEFRSGWDVGIGLQWDLWTWLTPAYQSDQAAAQLRLSEAMYDQLSDNATLEVARARLALTRVGEKIAVARGAVGQAEENVRSLTDKYRAGLATSSELLDAEVALLQAKTNLTGARVEYEIAAARLLNVSGTRSGTGNE